MNINPPDTRSPKRRGRQPNAISDISDETAAELLQLITAADGWTAEKEEEANESH